ncbi:MAG: sialidase family protein [Phycisphaerae bacterium]
MFRIAKQFVICPHLSQDPTVSILPNGDLLLLHTDYTDIIANQKSFLRRSSDGGLTWSEPEMTLNSDLPLGGITGAVSAIDNVVLIIYEEIQDHKRHPENPILCRFIRSTDGGKSWSQPQTLIEDSRPIHCYFGQAIRVKSGRILLPVYSFSEHITPPRGQVMILSSQDDGQTWAFLSFIEQDKSTLGSMINETSIIELPDGRILAISRTDLFDTEKGFPLGTRSISQDGGLSWTPATFININISETRMRLTTDGQLVMAARSWPGNVTTRYRPLLPEEREPGSNQRFTSRPFLMDRYYSPIRDWGVQIFTTQDDGQTWKPELLLDGLPELRIPEDADLLKKARYFTSYPCLEHLGNNRFFVAHRQPDPSMPDIYPGRTYSHVFQRFLLGNIVERVE